MERGTKLRIITELPIQSDLYYSDFEILDVVVTKDNRKYIIGPNTSGIFISRKDAFELYKNGSILKKSYDTDGELILCGVV